ncbi:MAG: polysaccharide pyruvyl transferase family protein [Candidatus Acidiferrum sp.]
MPTVQITPISSAVDPQALQPGPRIALITPYNGGNLGDAAIQDSMITNLRERLPAAHFLGITLNGDNFVKQHGMDAFPLLASGLASHQSAKSSLQPAAGDASEQSAASVNTANRKGPGNPIRRALRGIPGLVPLVKNVRARFAVYRDELAHALAGYRLLRSQDLLLLSGGGQLDEEYGGAWRLPFAYFKWITLARLARVPCAIASIGAGSIRLPASRRFISIALRLCAYRSYRETKSRAILANFFPQAANDLVVPDLAFSLPTAQLPPPSDSIRAMAHGRPVITLSPISYAKPGSWPTPNSALYDRYVQQLAQVLASLSRQGFFLVVVCSSLGDDESVIPDLLGRLDDQLKSSLDGQIHFPVVNTWRELVAVLRQSDYLIASRLHGTILGFVSQTPVVAISFDPKVDWVMEDVQQTDYLLHFRDFTADQVLQAIDRIRDSRNDVLARIVSYRQGVLAASASARQYDLLAQLALKHQQSHN